MRSCYPVSGGDEANAALDQPGVRGEDLRRSVIQHEGNRFSFGHGSAHSRGENGQQRNVPHLAGVSNSEVQGSHRAINAVIAVGSLRLHNDNLHILLHSLPFIGGLLVPPGFFFQGLGCFPQPCDFIIAVGLSNNTDFPQA